MPRRRARASGRFPTSPVRAPSVIPWPNSPRSPGPAISGAWSTARNRSDTSHSTCRPSAATPFSRRPTNGCLAPKGTGLLFVRPERQKELWSTLASSAWDDQADPMFRLMEYGTATLTSSSASVSRWTSTTRIGSARIQQPDFALADRLRSGLAGVPGATIVSPTHPDLTCGTTVYGLQNKTGAEIQDYLWSGARCGSAAWATSVCAMPATSTIDQMRWTRRWRS